MDYTVGGTLSSATGTVVLKLNGGSDLSMSNGPFTFATTLPYLATYNVQVVDANDRCTVTNGAGTILTTNVTNVAVTCGAQGTQKVIRSALLNGAQAGTMATGTGETERTSRTRRRTERGSVCRAPVTPTSDTK